MNSVRICSSRFMDVSRLGPYCLPCPKHLASCFTLTIPNRPSKQLLMQTTNSTLLSCFSSLQLGPMTISSYKISTNNFLVNNKMHSRHILYPSLVGSTFNKRSFWSNPGSQDPYDKVPTSASISHLNTSSSAGNDWTDAVMQVYRSISDALVRSADIVKETSNDLTPYIQQIIDSQPYIKDVIVPVSGFFSAALLTWFVMPRFLRRFYKYSMNSSLSLFVGRSSQEQIPYDRSLWSALENPIRYLVTFIAFSQLTAIIVPSTSVYLPQAWRGAVVLSFVWFLLRWKGYVVSRAVSYEALSATDREKLLALDKIASVGLLVVGATAVAEACGIAVQSVLTVGGVGGVATAFAAKDILGNLLNGLFLHFSKSFSIGDTIKAGSIEGQVVEIGLTTTCLLNAEKFPVTVPNSLFSSQVIVNKSRAQWHGMVSKIPVRVSDVEMIQLLSEDIKSMMKTHPKVFLEKEAPYCFLSQIEDAYAELTVGCNLKRMTKDELYATKQDILLEAVKLIKNRGNELGSTLRDCSFQ